MCGGVARQKVAQPGKRLTVILLLVLTDVPRPEPGPRATLRLFFFEPSVGWNAVGLPALPPFEHDDQVVYAPHIYLQSVANFPAGLDNIPKSLLRPRRNTP